MGDPRSALREARCRESLSPKRGIAFCEDLLSTSKSCGLTHRSDFSTLRTFPELQRILLRLSTLEKEPDKQKRPVRCCASVQPRRRRLLVCRAIPSSREDATTPFHLEEEQRKTSWRSAHTCARPLMRKKRIDRDGQYSGKYRKRH